MKHAPRATWLPLPRAPNLPVAGAGQSSTSNPNILMHSNAPDRGGVVLRDVADDAKAQKVLDAALRVGDLPHRPVHDVVSVLVAARGLLQVPVEALCGWCGVGSVWMGN